MLEMRHGGEPTLPAKGLRGFAYYSHVGQANTHERKVFVSQQHSPRFTTGSARATSSPGGTRSGSGGPSSRSGPTISRLHNAPPLESETLFVPPASMFALGGLGILVGIGANVWQM